MPVAYTEQATKLKSGLATVILLADGEPYLAEIKGSRGLLLSFVIRARQDDSKDLTSIYDMVAALEALKAQLELLS